MPKAYEDLICCFDFMGAPNILITGAAGSLGSVALQELRRRHTSVAGTDRIRQPGVLHANLLNVRSCARVLRSIDILIHLANLPGSEFLSDRQVSLINRRINDHVFRAACSAGIRKIIFASTIHVVSGSRRLPDNRKSELAYLPMDAGLPERPRTEYGLQKLCSERTLAFLAAKHGFSAIALRLPKIARGLPPSSPFPSIQTAFLDEAFSYLTHLDAVDLLDALIRTDLPGFRVYLPASLENSLHQPALDVSSLYFEGVPWRSPPPRAHTGLVDISTITQETGWTPLDQQLPELPKPRPRILHRIRRKLRNTCWARSR